MTLNRIGVLSCGKVMGVMYALIGLIIGVFFSLFAVLGAAISAGMGEGDGGIGMLFGAGAVIIMPIFYGICGFLGGLISAAVYNLVARIVGGLEMDLR